MPIRAFVRSAGLFGVVSFSGGDAAPTLGR
jgi:hypothetical protein